MKIGVDFDDVLVDSLPSLFAYYNSLYGTSYTREDNKSWYLEQLWGCTKEQAIELIRNWYHSKEHMQVLPMKGGPAAIAELKKMHDLYVVTSRASIAHEITSVLLEKHYKNDFLGLHFTDHFEATRVTKAHVCSKLGITVLIEDALTHALPAAEQGITVLLMNTPWNQAKIPDNIIRISGWDEAVDYIASQLTPTS